MIRNIIFLTAVNALHDAHVWGKTVQISATKWHRRWTSARWTSARCKMSLILIIPLLHQGAYKFCDGRRLPSGFRNIKQGNEGGETGDPQAAVQDPEVMARGQARRAKKEGYTRCDTLDIAKLKKYIKSVAKEAKLFRDARQE